MIRPAARYALAPVSHAVSGRLSAAEVDRSISLGAIVAILLGILQLVLENLDALPLPAGWAERVALVGGAIVTVLSLVVRFMQGRADEAARP